MTVHPQKENWWYASVVDWMLANPDKTKRDCAAAFNVTPQWIYVLSQSDVFKTLLAARRREHNQMVSGTIVEKLEGFTEMVLDTMTEKWVAADIANAITMGFAKDTLDMTLSKLGYSGKGNSPAPQVQVNVLQATPEVLEAARQRMSTLGQSEGAPPELPMIKDITPQSEARSTPISEPPILAESFE